MKITRHLSRILLVVFVVVFMVYFVRNIEDFKSLRNLDVPLVLLVMLGYVASTYVNGLFNRVIIVPFGKKISKMEGFRVALLSSIGNYFGPLLGGASFRAIYLKKKVNLSYTDFMSTLYGYYVIAFLISAFLGLVSLLLITDGYGRREFFVIAIFFTLTICALVSIIYNKYFSFIEPLIKKLSFGKYDYVKRLGGSWRKIRSYDGLIVSLVRITFLNIGLLVFINYCEFLLIGVNLDLRALILYSCLGVFSILISLTPGALGIREAVYLFSAGIIGVSSSEILAVALIDRTLQFVVMGIGWVSTSVAKRWFLQDIN